MLFQKNILINYTSIGNDLLFMIVFHYWVWMRRLMYYFFLVYYRKLIIYGRNTVRSSVNNLVKNLIKMVGRYYHSSVIFHTKIWKAENFGHFSFYRKYFIHKIFVLSNYFLTFLILFIYILVHITFSTRKF